MEIGSTFCSWEMSLVVSPSPDRIMIVSGLGVEESVEERVMSARH